MRILALDLGTKTGWAHEDFGSLSSGTWRLLTEKERKKQSDDAFDRCCDMRFARLRQNIESLGPLDFIVFEDVQFLSTQLQAQLWAGLRSVVILHSPVPTHHIRCLPVGTLKKFATGHGNATKEMMLDALVRNYPLRFKPSSLKPGQVLEANSNRPVDDNEADAFHLLMWAKQEAKNLWK